MTDETVTTQIIEPESKKYLFFTYSLKDRLENVLMNTLNSENLITKYFAKLKELPAKTPLDVDLNKYKAMIEVFTTARLFTSAYVAALILSVVMLLKTNKIQNAIPYVKRAYNLWTVIQKSGDWQSLSPYERAFEVYKHKQKLELNDFLYLVLREILKYCVSKSGMSDRLMNIYPFNTILTKNKL